VNKVTLTCCGWFGGVVVYFIRFLLVCVCVCGALFGMRFIPNGAPHTHTPIQT